VAILVTGNAGFIGFHTAKTLLERGDDVVGIDVVNDYYDPAVKEARLKILEETARRSNTSYTFVRGNLADRAIVEKTFENNNISRVINLAAQAGVRYSIENPHAYVESNIVGFTNILEACRHGGVEHLVYAATKKANELMAHSYSHLYRLPTTGLRFFTVYGPWGRPDMALFLFAKNIIEGKPINVFNYGNHTRDFTYVSDIVEGVIRACDKPAAPNPAWDARNPDPATSDAPYRIYNIGNNNPVKLTEYIEALEEAIGKKAERNLLPLQAGDVPDTYADVSDLERELGYKPRTSVREGVANFVKWYQEYTVKAQG
jgi:UDP-glucuronate 4-epimerase